MVTLEQLVKEQKWNGVSDIQIIKTFFDMNNMEEEGVDMIHELSKTKINKLKCERKVVRDWTSYLPSKYLYENYDLETANMLHTLELDYLSNGCNLSQKRIEWARENIPNIKMPKVYFRPLIDWMKDKVIVFNSK